MHLYKTIPQFNQYTGKPADPTLEIVGVVDDYSGFIIEEHEDVLNYHGPLYSFSINYNRGV